LRFLEGSNINFQSWIQKVFILFVCSIYIICTHLVTISMYEQMNRFLVKRYGKNQPRIFVVVGVASAIDNKASSLLS
jgi:peptidoglycan/LPS O-acetylase OafA/YrhL